MPPAAASWPARSRPPPSAISWCRPWPTGRSASIAEAREVVRRSFDVEQYEPRNTAAWDDAYPRFLEGRWIKGRYNLEGCLVMFHVGIVGIGFMGMIHYLAYQRLRGVKVHAICEQDPLRRGGDWRTIKGNFGPPGELMDLSGVAQYADLDAMLADPKLDLIDICLPTALARTRRDSGPGGRQARLVREADRPDARRWDCHGRSGRTRRAAC